MHATGQPVIMKWVLLTAEIFSNLAIKILHLNWKTQSFLSIYQGSWIRISRSNNQIWSAQTIFVTSEYLPALPVSVKWASNEKLSTKDLSCWSTKEREILKSKWTRLKESGTQRFLIATSETHWIRSFLNRRSLVNKMLYLTRWSMLFPVSKVSNRPQTTGNHSLKSRVPSPSSTDKTYSKTPRPTLRQSRDSQISRKTKAPFRKDRGWGLPHQLAMFKGIQQIEKNRSHYRVMHNLCCCKGSKGCMWRGTKIRWPNSPIIREDIECGLMILRGR